MAGRVLITATGSNTGKTTITCAILYCLMKRGYDVVSFKCGPDYIDPMFHRKIIGNRSYNLDSFFLDRERLIDYMCEHMTGDTEDSICVMEGAMGYYDGVDFSVKASAYETACITDTPAILIVNGSGMANSCLAVIKGFLEYENNSNIRGIILNRVSPNTYERLKPQIEEFGVKVCGYVPTLNKELMFESRHLGLVTADEVNQLKEKLEGISNIISGTVDMDAIIEISKMCGKLNYKSTHYSIDISQQERVTLAVARDEAFSFMYEENLELLHKAGCDFKFFSPLRDREIPVDTHGLLLMGGYPEVYAKELSRNTGMIESVRNAIERGMPVVAECGGFMYLCDTICTEDGNEYPMVGVIKGISQKRNRLVRFGYIELEALCDNILCGTHEKIRAHEFHYWDCDNNGTSFLAKRPGKCGSYECIVADGNIFAGYPHLYYPSNPSVAYNLANVCREYKNGRYK